MPDILAAQLAGPIDYAKHQLAVADAAARPPATTLSAEDQALLAELAAAARGWRESDEGQAFLASLGGLTAEQVRAELEAVVRGPRFEKARKFSLGLLPKAISLGVAGQAELLLGVYGSVGYIHDLSLELAGGGLYLLLATAEGLEGAVDVSVQVGIWTESTDEVSGKYIGGELDADDVFGLSGFLLLDDEDPKACLIDIDGGIADGASKLEFHMWAHNHGSSGPVSQAPASKMLILETLQCFDTSENGHDEVYLTFEIDGDSSALYRYPTWNYYAMKPGAPEGKWNLGRSVWCETRVDVIVYDQDSSRHPDRSDQIASFTIRTSDFAGVGSSHKKTYSAGQNGGSYQLTAYLMDLTA
jgi:hypothetical protein